MTAIVEDPPLFTISGEDSHRLGVFFALKCFVLSIPKDKSPQLMEGIAA